MLKKVLLITCTILLSCNGKEISAEKKKVVCADSFEVEQFDEQGNSLIIKQAGKCDTVVENSAH